MARTQSHHKGHGKGAEKKSGASGAKKAAARKSSPKSPEARNYYEGQQGMPADDLDFGENKGATLADAPKRHSNPIDEEDFTLDEENEIDDENIEDFPPRSKAKPDFDI